MHTEVFGFFVFCLSISILLVRRCQPKLRVVIRASGTEEFRHGGGVIEVYQQLSQNPEARIGNTQIEAVQPKITVLCRSAWRLLYQEKIKEIILYSNDDCSHEYREFSAYLHKETEVILLTPKIAERIRAIKLVV